MLLVYPPVARSTEAPCGIARLAGSLRAAGYTLRCLDLNQEGFDWLLGADAEAKPASDTWSKRAESGRSRNLAALREASGYANFDRYKRAVLDLNRSLSAAAKPRITLADYADPELSPLRSEDLVRSARKFESNPFFPLFSGRIEEVLAEYPARTLGISLIFLSQALTAFAMAGWLRARHPELRILMGGGLVTSWAGQESIDLASLFGSLVDGFLPGPGEESLAAPLAKPGKDGGAEGFRGTLPYACPDFDDFPLDSYFSPGRTIPYSFSTGCPWKRCSFCPEKAEGSPYRSVAPELARAHLAHLAERYRPRLFHFTDNEISPARLGELAAWPPGIPWYGFARFSRELVDAAFCRALARSGCAMLQLGLESGEQSVLDALGKGTRLDEIDAILANLRDAGIASYVYVLFGTPAETRESALATRDFLETRSEGIGFINAAIFNMPRSGEEASGYLAGSFYEGDLSLYCSFRHPSGWDRSAVRAFLSRDFGTSPAIRSILARTPPIFTSNHAVFFPRAGTRTPP
jgi:hypothetical protein